MLYLICIISRNFTIKLVIGLFQNLVFLLNILRRNRCNKIIVVCIHLSNVLTDHFSNPVSEKTRNDIPMKFLQCYLKTIIYRLPLPNR